MANDSGLFRTEAELVSQGYTPDGSAYIQGTKKYVPLYEGRLGHQFNHRFASQSRDKVTRAFTKSIDGSIICHWYTVLDFSERIHRSRIHRHRLGCTSALLGFRRVARNTDERTCVACVFPWMAASYGWILSLGPSCYDYLLLVAAYNSLPFDYCLRLARVSLPFHRAYFSRSPVHSQQKLVCLRTNLSLSRSSLIPTSPRSSNRSPETAAMTARHFHGMKIAGPCFELNLTHIMRISMA